MPNLWLADRGAAPSTPNGIKIRLNEAGRLRYLAQTHPLNATQRHELAGQLRPMASGSDGVGHPWPCPLPANWSLSFTGRQPLPYTQVEPTVVAEIEVDGATGAAGRPRHLARHVRTRADLLPEHLPLWCPGRGSDNLVHYGPMHAAGRLEAAASSPMVLARLQPPEVVVSTVAG